MFSVELDGVTKEIFSTEDLVADIKNQLIIYANEVLRDEQKEGFPSEPVIAVDGKFDKSVNDVKAFGKVEYFNTEIDIVDSLRDAYDVIHAKSPKGSKLAGDKYANIKYINHNYVYFNKAVVATNRLEMRRWLDFMSQKGFRPRDEIAFVNVVPYARKLEKLGITNLNVGVGGKKARFKKRGGVIKAQLPNGVYYAAQRSMVNLLRGRALVAPVKFEPFNLRVGGMRNTFANGGRPYLYPVIKVFPITGKGIIQ